MGLGESGLRQVCVICKILYSAVIVVGFTEEGREDLTFRSFWGGVGRGSRVAGRDWAWWSGKALELIDFGAALQRYIAFCIGPCGHRLDIHGFQIWVAPA